MSKRFDPHEWVQKAREIRSIVDPELGTIEYMTLTVDDILVVNKMSQDKEERVKLMIWKMLSKTYPDLKPEDVSSFPPRILEVLLLKTGVLPQVKEEKKNE